MATISTALICSNVSDSEDGRVNVTDIFDTFVFANPNDRVLAFELFVVVTDIASGDHTVQAVIVRPNGKKTPPTSPDIISIPAGENSQSTTMKFQLSMSPGTYWIEVLLNGQIASS